MLTGAGNAQAANRDAWQTIPSTNGTQEFNQLYGVAAISKNNAWAVGASTGSSNQSLIEHWNGSSWQTVSTPDSGLYPVLHAVAAIPETNQVWAVGTQWTVANGVQTLIERWNGSSWQIIPSPLIQGNTGDPTNILYSVVATSKDNAWATGVYNKNASHPQAELIEHWNGKQWSIVPGATIPGANYGWLYGVTACSANNVWAVGQSIGTAGENTLVEHWNGHVWQLSQAQNPGAIANNLYGVACIPGTKQLWATGNSLTAGSYQTLTERWNGTTWQILPSPNSGTFGSNLVSVTALSPDNAWAVGNGNGDDQGLIEHWDGTSWNVVSQPATINELAAIARVPGTDTLWAVGDYYASDYNSQLTLIEQYS